MSTMPSPTPDKKKRPSSPLEMYMATLEGKTGDEHVDETNLGTGFYTNAEYYQQVHSFRISLFAKAAVGRTIVERAIEEAKDGIVDAIFMGEYEHWAPDPDEPPEERELLASTHRDDYKARHIDEIWERLGSDSEQPSYKIKAAAVAKYSTVSADWEPPHSKMLKMRHEASKSKSARLQDNIFGRVKEYLGNIKEDDAEI